MPHQGRSINSSSSGDDVIYGDSSAKLKIKSKTSSASATSLIKRYTDERSTSPMVKVSVFTTNCGRPGGPKKSIQLHKSGPPLSIAPKTHSPLVVVKPAQVNVVAVHAKTNVDRIVGQHNDQTLPTTTTTNENVSVPQDSQPKQQSVGSSPTRRTWWSQFSLSYWVPILLAIICVGWAFVVAMCLVAKQS